MRTPARIATHDVFAQSVAAPGHIFAPGGGDGTSVTPTTPTSGVGAGSVPVVYFTETSFANTQASTIWAWTFRSGTTVLGTSTVQNPIFTFPGPGSYSVTMVTDLGVAIHTVVVN